MSTDDKTQPPAAERETESKEHKSEVEILAQALAETSREATQSGTKSLRIVGVLLALSVLGNIALAGLQIKGSFFGTDIEMGGPSAEEPAFFPPEDLEELGYFDEDEAFHIEEMPVDVQQPSEGWCFDMKDDPELHPADLAWCKELYPHLWK